MPNIGSSLTGGSVTIEGSTAARTYALSMPTSGTEYSQALGSNVKQVIIKTRNGAGFKIAWNSGDIAAGNYLTVNSRASYEKTQMKFTGTVYLECTANGETAEIEVWT